jgi:hypothetical protein
VPLLFTLMTWWLLARRRVSPITLLVVYLLIAMIGAFPFFGDASTCGSSILHAFGPCPPPAEAASAFLMP